RMGGLGDPELARMVFEELEKRGLAKPSADGASIPMHPMIRSLYLVLLAQILREAGPGIGIELSPATDRPRVQAALVELLSAPTPRAGAAHVVTFDLEVVGPDLDAVPLDEVLGFRAAHGEEYRRYARRLREVVGELSTRPQEECGQILNDRRQELRDAADALRGEPMRRLTSIGSIALGIAGGVVTAVTGDLLVGVLSGGAAAAGMATLPRKAMTPYSYLFAMQRELA
ncbi:MAG: hypothetical protein ACRDRD_08210, partial [Pseudonocardiaceae bacterium]